MTTTINDVRSMARRYVRACLAVGALQPGDRITVTEGSRTYGRPWHVYRIPAGESGYWSPPIGRDFLGWSKREAYDTLANFAAAAEDTARLCGNDAGPYLSDEEVSAYLA